MEIVRMKLTPDNMRGMCNWIVADQSIHSHRLNMDNGLEITIDFAGDQHLTVKQDQWLVKYADNSFKVDSREETKKDNTKKQTQ